MEGGETHTNKQEESDVDPLLIMEELINKLKILDYENLFTKQK